MLAETLDIGGGSAIAVVVIIAFAIERTVTALLFLLPFNHTWARYFPDPASIQDPGKRIQAERRARLIYYSLASFLALIIAWVGNVRLLHALGLTDSRVVLDIFVTVLVLVAGSDILAHVTKLSGAPGSGASSQQPIEITGKLVLEEGTLKKSEAAGSDK